MGPGKVFALAKQLLEAGIDFITFGVPSTAGVRLKLESGDLAVREGDDSGYANLKVNNLTIGGTTTGFTPTLSMVVVQRLTAQTIAAATGSYISWATETRDDLGISAVGAGANTKICTFTAPGVWDSKLGMQVGVAAGYHSLGLELYDSLDALKWAGYLAGALGNGANGTYMSVADTLRVASGDYLKAAVYIAAGADIGSVNPYTHCSLTLLGT